MTFPYACRAVVDGSGAASRVWGAWARDPQRRCLQPRHHSAGSADSQSSLRLLRALSRRYPHPSLPLIELPYAHELWAYWET